MTDEEQFIRQQIAAIHREYSDRIKPWVDRLVRIESMRVRPVWIDARKFPGVDIDAVHKAVADNLGEV